MATKESANSKLNMASVNGIILALIGILVLITPLRVELSGYPLAMDLIAGGVLVVGGGFSLLWGWTRRPPAGTAAAGTTD